jgi:ABC-2 type transport system permease protein
MIADTLALTWRNLIHVRRIPEKLLDATLQPVVFVLLFVLVFGRAIDVPGGDYASYLMAGIFVQTLVFGAMGSSMSMAEDLTNGAIERFRTLPISRGAVLAARTTADALSSCVALVVLTVTGLIVGWNIDAGVGDVVAAFALLLLFAYAISWLGTLLGLIVRSADAAQGLVFMIGFPLTFLANSFVPTSSLSPVLRTFAEWNPVSALVAATRDLFGNPTGIAADAPWPMEHAVLAALLWTALILAVCVPLSIARYRRAA